MADIQMCTATGPDGRVCLLAHLCYRQTAPRSEWQAWGPPAPDFTPATGCANMIEKKP